MFFPEIGRAAISAYIIARGVLPAQEVMTLTVIAITDGVASNKVFLELCAGLWEAGNLDIPAYAWTNVDGTVGRGTSPGQYWPLNQWFTFSATFRPGSVTGYLSNRGIINVELSSGVWPTTLAVSRDIKFALVYSGSFAADGFVHLRELSLTELHAISDLGNVDYRMPGEAPLILPVRTYWPSVLPVAPSYLKRRSLGARSGTREAAL
jgi:hypothetical protein